MGEPEGWRFQWPDGTWIRWNPLTQSWEKEAGDAAPPREQTGVAEPEAPAVVEPAEPEPESEPESEPEPAVDEPESEPAGDDYAAVPRRRSSGRRPMVDDVLPPPDEPVGSGRSLWPTIVTGIVVGIGVGVVVLEMIR